MTRSPDQAAPRPAEQPAPRPADQPTPRPAEQLRSDARQNHARLISAATAAFAEKGADAPLEDIARRAGVIRSDVTAMDVMRLLHGVAVSSERDPDRTDLLLSVTLDGLAAGPGRG